MDLWDLVSPYAPPYAATLAAQNSMPALLGMSPIANPLMGISAAENAVCLQDSRLAKYNRHKWRRTVSQNWLNLMLDIELGI